MSNKRRYIAYIPTGSLLDRLNPLTKLVFLFCFIIAVFIAKSYIFLGSTLLFCFIAVFVAKIGRVFYYYLSGLIFILILFLFIMQALFYPANKTLLLHIYFIRLYTEGISYAAVISLRLINLVAVFLLFIMTTKPKKMVSVLVLKGLNPKFAYLILATLQIAPQISRKSYKIREAQMSRGLKTSGNLITRFKAFLPLLSPLISGSLAEVEERALALEIRGFNSPTPKTCILEVPDSKRERILRYLFIGLLIIYIIWEART